MSECPFCGAAIQNDLVMYGGPCPKCFAEIPGEEAPTDPGAEARAVQERRDRRGATMKAFLGLAVMAAVVSCTGIAALTVVLWPEPEVAVLDFDSMEYGYPAIELVGNDPSTKDGPGEEGTVGAVVKGPKPKSPNVAGYVPVPGAAPIDGAASARDGLGADGVAVAAPRTAKRTRGGPEGPVVGPTGLDGVALGDKPKYGGLDAPDPVIARQSEVLTDSELIRIMIGKLMKQQVGRLNYCYERQLKNDPTLGGRWLIKYTVTKDGKAVNATATGRDRKHAEMEQCLVENIQTKWRFDRIVRDQPVKRTLTFRPG